MAASPVLAAWLLLAVVCAAVVSTVITWLSRPLLQRYALARPNARSSHRIPTPQGAGIAVIAATLLIAFTGASWLGIAIPPAIAAATILITLVGFADDLRSLPVLLRLVLQAASVGILMMATDDSSRIVPALPVGIERGLILVAGVWFVNLVNFMDGLDLMTVAEVVPVTAALMLLGWSGDLQLPATLIAAALCGGMLGFAPFNRPVAKVFLGDVGSLPIGLLLGWCLLELAFQNHVAAALLLPAYYLADSTTTLFRRIARREPFWSAHRSHFYQRATDHGFAVTSVIRHVFALNVLLALLAIATTRMSSLALNLLALAAGAAAVAYVLNKFSRPRRA